MTIRALSFDTGGTVLDWHGGIVARLAAVCGERAAGLDLHQVANDWRRRAMKRIVGQLHPTFNMDDAHRESLRETLSAHGLGDLSSGQKDAIWSSWYELDAWPDFAPALDALRAAVPVVSFTMLPTALVMSVSRRNALAWDAIVSCEMIGVYKPHAQAYATAARWIGLQPQDILMVACHNFDLNAAHAAGYKTAFVRRPDEWGPEGPPEPEPNMDYTFVVSGFDELRRLMLDSQ
ncbi:MAG: haloacid dehalogenase type II [Burkholderiaceae bacterium]|jgi:2-haloacid dehalogenase|nr:haloacid dehalogenase type II [Aquabacterium sp.]NUP85425.1 haloacid dehalogenase type II [Burkholderiaceae bacterium]